MALVARRTAAAGGADATFNSAATAWTAVDALLIAAGWTVLHDYSSGVLGWVASTGPVPGPQVDITYNAGDVVEVNGNRYQCIQSGATAFSPATGPTGTGQSIVDRTCVWRFLSSAGASDKVYTSTGESGNEKIFVQVGYNTNPAPVLNFRCFQYFDTATKFGYNPIYPGALTNITNQYGFTAATTVNYAMVADKDSFVGITVDSSNARRLFAGGLLKRQPSLISTFFTSNGAVTAGPNKTFSFSSGDPIASGYRVGDRVFVVSQQSNPGAIYVQTVPVYAAVITALTSSSITIDFAQEDTAAGAFIGADPQPFFCFGISTNTSPVSLASTAFVAYKWNNNVVNLFTAGPAANQGYPNAIGGGGISISGAAEVDPDNRTNRVFLSEQTFLINAGAGGLVSEVVGIIPKLYVNPRTSDALWAIGRTTKAATNYDYVTFPNQAPSTGQRNAVGPIAISGSSNYTAQVVPVDTNLITEAEIQGPREGAGQAVDRTHNVFMVGKDGHPFQAEGVAGPEDGIAANSADLFSWVVYLPNTPQQVDRASQIFLHSGEPIPQDSPSARTGGTNSGFNSGFN